MHKVSFSMANRIKKLPPYLFAEIDKKREEIEKRIGKDKIINLSIGDPDLPTSKPIIEKLYEAARNPENHRYPSYTGMIRFRKEIAKFMKRRFNVDFNENEVIGLIGSKEGIAHLPLGIINIGDNALYTDPGYPVYKTSIIFAGGNPIQVPLLKENKFLPDLDELSKKIKKIKEKKRNKKIKLMFLGYPNNPTAAVADLKFFEKVVDFAYENEILIAHDNAYSEMTFDGYIAPSIFQVKDAKDVAIEFFSFSKTYNMTGWRVGFAVGSEKNLKFLAKVKENFDSGIFNAIQLAAVEALTNKDVENEYKRNMKIFEERRNVACKILKEYNAEFEVPKATFYIWVKVNKSSIEFCNEALNKGVIFTPGIGFGEYGEGYVRIAITQSKEKIEEGLRRLESLFKE
ncbi:MAG: LL-diaminopimelate aminotransferase [Candidatus Altarchaeaceae archaeon]